MKEVPPVRDRGVVAIVGRPNVGKSTLFNRIAGQRIAIEEPTPGITRDRIYADCEWMGKRFTLIDTGGLEIAKDDLQTEIRRQIEFAIQEADALIFVVDAKEGPAAFDEEIAEMLRRTGKPVVLAANKVDSRQREDGVPDFYGLALGEVVGVSAVHGLLVDELLDLVAEHLPETPAQEEEEDLIRIAIVGRPNVGKSSLLNAILGEHRVAVNSEPGTTRDSIDTQYEWKGQSLVLIDTAGVRRKSRVKEDFEYYSVLRSFGAIERADIALTLIDASEGLTDQDKRIAGHAHEEGKAQVFVVSKWDLRLPEAADEKSRKTLMQDFARDLHAWVPEIRYAPITFTSSVKEWGIDALLDTAVEVAEQHAYRFQTAELNRLFEEATWDRPLSRKGKQLKIYYVTQVSTRPPTIALFVNEPKLFHFSHMAYLENQIRKRVPLEGTPIRLLLRKARGKDRERRREVRA
ncbi:MAG: ribosome biogenesis GTPase Der [Armatimonadetes bacterium]|nr:ribosome biogenesis GTPase Der [Armatimonadota bacterium]